MNRLIVKYTIKFEVELDIDLDLAILRENLRKIKGILQKEGYNITKFPVC